MSNVKTVTILLFFIKSDYILARVYCCTLSFARIYKILHKLQIVLLLLAKKRFKIVFAKWNKAEIKYKNVNVPWQLTAIKYV